MYYANFNCKYLKDCTVKFTVTYTSIRPVSSVVLLPCRTQINLAQQWHDDRTAAVSKVEPKAEIAQGKILPGIAKNVGGVDVPPLIVGDSAFPFQTWLMKPYTNAVLTEKQKYFNYRLSRARMVSEGAYGQLKGRWRVLFRRNECSQKNVRTVTMACIVL